MVNERRRYFSLETELVEENSGIIPLMVNLVLII